MYTIRLYIDAILYVIKGYIYINIQEENICQKKTDECIQAISQLI